MKYAVMTGLTGLATYLGCRYVYCSKHRLALWLYNHAFHAVDDLLEYLSGHSSPTSA